jgi:hypothetical protein
MQPLKKDYSADFDIMPLTVVADPKKLREILSGGDSKADYIMRIQYLEADIILINKTDTLSETDLQMLVADTEKAFPQCEVLTASGLKNTGVKEWLSKMEQIKSVGKTIAEVDYDRYADGEAAFGWLNVTYEIPEKTDTARSSDWLLHELCRIFKGINIGHIKFIEQGGGKIYIGNITDGAEDPVIKIYDARSAVRGLTINARAETTPEILYDKVSEAVGNVFYEFGGARESIKNLLIPGRPNPTYRFEKPVETAAV